MKQSIAHSNLAMQDAYSSEMAPNDAEQPDAPVRPARAARRARLQDLLDEFGGPAAVARRTGTVASHLTACEKGRRGIGDDLATKLETGCNKPPGWMDYDDRRWPFKRVPPSVYEKLDPNTKILIEGYVEGKIAEAGIDSQLGGDPPNPMGRPRRASNE